MSIIEIGAAALVCISFFLVYCAVRISGKGER